MPGMGPSERAASAYWLATVWSVQVPATRYAVAADGVSVAYQTVGEGPSDLVFIPSAMSHIEVFWEDPSVAHYLQRLASFARLIMFDKRGVGMSDRVASPATLEERMDDVRAVMDAAGSPRAALLGTSEGGAIGALFAATYPERVSSLVMLNASTRCRFDTTLSEPELEALVVEHLAEHHGSGESIEAGAPSVAHDPSIRAWAGRVERLAGSPASALAMFMMNLAFDARAALPAVLIPTLVIHRSGDRVVDVEQGREAARLIPSARYVELEGTDHLPFWEDPEATLALIQEFTTGERFDVEGDRVLATILFTDIVESTRHASTVGDRRWKDLLERYDSIVDREIDRFHGKVVNTTGDGTVATFDGPGRGVHCALCIRDAAHSIGLAIRAGLHTGEVMMRGNDITGLAVVIAQRVSAMAASGEVVVSRTVRDLTVGSALEYDELGEHQLKGVPDTWTLLRVHEPAHTIDRGPAQ
jgi:pimeloyl-ACP methyl ester carboxylesterase